MGSEGRRGAWVSGREVGSSRVNGMCREYDTCDRKIDESDSTRTSLVLRNTATATRHDLYLAVAASLTTASIAAVATAG